MARSDTDVQIVRYIQEKVRKTTARFPQESWSWTLVFKCTSAFSRGILKQKKWKILLFNGDSVTRELLLFHTVCSVNQFSVDGVVADWCYEFDRWRKERRSVTLKNWVLPMVEPEEVEMLVSSPNLAFGNKMQGSASFLALEKKMQICSNTFSQHLVTARNSYTIRPDEDVGEGTVTPVPRIFEFSILSEYSSLGSYSPGTIIGPVQEVRIVKLHNGYAIEVAIPSICKPQDTFHVVRKKKGDH